MEKDNNFFSSLCKKNGFLYKICSFLLINSKLLITKINSSKELKARVISSLILLPIAIFAIFISSNLFVAILLAVAILLTLEWVEMVNNLKQDEKKWKIIGFFYILIPLYCAYRIRMIDANILFWMFSIIWVTDIAAFFAGKALGGPKLCPKISPNKTWTGLLGGTLASAIIGFFSSFIFPGSIIFFITISALLSIIEQISDLTESKLKRIFGVKDSGNIIPGHGGVLDRLDGMILSAPFVLIIITIFSKNFGL